jgi:uncharacterized protein YndB with AHSA1/START domain
MSGRADSPAIDASAPVVSHAEAEIHAPIDGVWAVLTAIDRWPSWNPDVEWVSMVAPVERGSTFRWKAGPATISSLIEHVESPSVIAWSGKTLGIRAFHVWRLASENGTTHVRTEESYHGLVARLLRRSLRKTLDAALADGVGYLKAAAESAVGENAGPPGTHGAAVAPEARPADVDQALLGQES